MLNQFSTGGYEVLCHVLWIADRLWPFSGFGGSAGAGHHGAGEAGVRPRHRPPGRQQVSPEFRP